MPYFVKPVTLDVGLVTVVIVGVVGPLTIPHMPVPVVMVLAASVVEVVVVQMEMSAPAFGVVGDAVTVSDTLDAFEGQAPFEMVQVNPYTPGVRFVTVLLFCVGVVITAPPGPEICVQVPVPIVGTLPFSVSDVPPQKLWLAPATEVDAVLLMVTCMVSRLGEHPLRERLHSSK